MPQHKNIFNIPAQQHFFESFFEWISNNFPDQIHTLTIFLPNHRSCRELQQILLERSSAQSVILPTIKSISDLSYEDFFDFLPNDEVKKIIEELIQIKLICSTDYLFFLSQKVRKLALFGSNIQANQALNIASQLESLFNEIEKDEINLDKLTEIDDSDLSKHRQITLDFLKTLHIHIKNALIKDNTYFASSYQNFITNRFVECLEKYGSETPIIIAGSTGSLSAGKKLIKAISSQANGFAFVQGFKQSSRKINKEYHPQFLLNELANFLDVTDIQTIHNPRFTLSSKERSSFIDAIMLPEEESLKWQNIESLLDCPKVTQDLKDNFKIIQTRDELEEARIIALMLSEARQEKKKCAVITNNNKLSQFLKNELNKKGLNFNDSRALNIAHSKLITFILSLLELLENDFAPYDLLAIFKSPLCQYHTSPLLKEFEIKILREARKSSGQAGIKDKLQTLKNKDLTQFFTQFLTDITAISSITSDVSIATYSKSLITTIEHLSGQTWTTLLEQEDAQIEIFEFFEEVTSQHDFQIDGAHPLLTFKTLFSKVSYFEKSDTLSEIQILPTIEARLINRDLVIISSLNEGDFPEIESDNWLGKKIKRDLGIDKKLKKIGQNAYDFCNHLGNPSVILTRPLIRNGSISVCSPFLLKFETLCQKLDIQLDRGDKYFTLLQQAEDLPPIQSKRPNPKPALEFRPKNLAITDISKLRQDPYSIYARKILNLRELPKIDFEPGYAEFGSFVHEALEEFIKKPQDTTLFLEKAAKIFEKYFIAQQAKLIWWPKFENMFAGFLEQESTFKDLKNYTEIPVKLVINDILIRGKIDRLILDEEKGVAIFDYKTGQSAPVKNVKSGLEPQLTIAALMLVEGVIEGEIRNLQTDEISSINYWKLSASTGSEIKEMCKKNEELHLLIMAAKSGIGKLFDHFANPENGYICAPDLQHYKENEYAHLARVKQWS